MNQISVFIIKEMATVNQNVSCDNIVKRDLDELKDFGSELQTTQVANKKRTTSSFDACCKKVFSKLLVHHIVDLFAENDALGCN